jgi:hypothetical protein
MSTSVKYLRSNMTGAPVIVNNWGDMTSMLDAVLVNGFNARTPTSVTRAGDTVTVVFAAAHGYEFQQVVAVSGAAQSQYNGEFRVTAANTLSIQYKLPAGAEPASPATGTIGVKTAPLGFEVVFSATHKRVYRSPNVQGNRAYIRVDDSLPSGYTTTWAKFARVTIAEAMSDIDTFLPGGRAPFSPTAPNFNEQGNGLTGTAGAYGWHKWYFSTSTSAGGSVGESSADPGGTKNWNVVGDDRGFYFQIGQLWNNARFLYGVGDFASYRPGDAYNTLLFAHANSNTAGLNTTSWNIWGGNISMFDYDGRVAMRGWQQIGNPVRIGLMSLSTVTSSVATESGYNTTVQFPNGPDTGTLVHPIYLREESPFVIRGVLPGAYWALQPNAHTHRAVLDNVSGLPGRSLTYLSGTATAGSTAGNTAGVWLDITGPWER